MEIKDHTLIECDECSTAFGTSIYSLVHKKDGELFGNAGWKRKIGKFEPDCSVVKYNATDEDLLKFYKKYKNCNTVFVDLLTSDACWNAFGKELYDK